MRRRRVDAADGEPPARGLRTKGNVHTMPFTLKLRLQLVPAGRVLTSFTCRLVTIQVLNELGGLFEYPLHVHVKVQHCAYVPTGG